MNSFGYFEDGNSVLRDTMTKCVSKAERFICSIFYALEISKQPK